MEHVNLEIHKKVTVKNHRKSKTPDNPFHARSYMLQYFLTYTSTSNPVCKQGFLNILAIKKGCINTALKSVTDAGTPKRDRRGHHPKTRCITRDKVKYVTNYTASFPTVSCHYTIAKSPHRRYLDTKLSVNKMYRIYMTWMKREYPKEYIVRKSYYWKVFNTNFNLSCKLSETYTRSKCDQLNIAIKAVKEDVIMTTITTPFVMRKTSSRQAAKDQKIMKEVAQYNDDDMPVVCIDLQQTLPIRRHSTNVAYYKRKLWM